MAKQNEPIILPQYMRPYFWDVNFEDVDVRKNPKFILKRIIDKGDTKALLWGMKIFTLDDIKDIIITSRDINPRTANFWAFVMGIDPKNVPCLQKPYSRTLFGPSN